MSSGPILEPAGEDVPAGFQRGPGGLLVPIGTPTLERELWRWEDGMAIERAYRVARTHNLLLMVGCNDNRCAELPVVRREERPGGGFAWLCLHKERHVTKGPRGRRRWP